MKAKKKTQSRTIRGAVLRTPLAKIRHQMQIRATAGQSPALTPVVKAALDSWTQDTDKMAALVHEVEVARQTLKKLSGELHTAEAAYATAERGYYTAVDLVSQGNADTIHSLGCQSSGAVRPSPGAIEPPATVTAKPGMDPGAVHLSWTKAPGAVAYLLQVSSDPPTDASWRSVPGTTRLREALGSLGSGARMWFRVASLGSTGQSRYGEPVVTTVR